MVEHWSLNTDIGLLLELAGEGKEVLSRVLGEIKLASMPRWEEMKRPGIREEIANNIRESYGYPDNFPFRAGMCYINDAVQQMNCHGSILYMVGAIDFDGIVNQYDTKDQDKVRLMFRNVWNNLEFSNTGELTVEIVSNRKGSLEHARVETQGIYFQRAGIGGVFRVSEESQPEGARYEREGSTIEKTAVSFGEAKVEESLHKELLKYAQNCYFD